MPTTHSELKRHQEWHCTNLLGTKFRLHPRELNKEIRASKPSEYFAKFKKENPDLAAVLKTHLIPSEANSSIWTDNYDTFVKVRAAAI